MSKNAQNETQVVMTQAQFQALMAQFQALTAPVAKAEDDNPNVAAVKASPEYKAEKSAAKRAWMVMRARHTAEELSAIHKAAAEKASATRKAKQAKTEAALASAQALLASLTQPTQHQ